MFEECIRKSNSQLKEEGFKNADVFENGVKAEYKRITGNSVNLGRSIQRALREGKEQAERIVVWIDKESIDMHEIFKGLKHAQRHDKKGKIKDVVLIDKNGKGMKYDRV